MIVKLPLIYRVDLLQSGVALPVSWRYQDASMLLDLPEMGDKAAHLMSLAPLKSREDVYYNAKGRPERLKAIDGISDELRGEYFEVAGQIYHVIEDRVGLPVISRAHFNNENVNAIHTMAYCYGLYSHPSDGRLGNSRRLARIYQGNFTKSPNLPGSTMVDSHRFLSMAREEVKCHLVGAISIQGKVARPASLPKLRQMHTGKIFLSSGEEDEAAAREVSLYENSILARFEGIETDTQNADRLLAYIEIHRQPSTEVKLSSAL